ncbi:hypothetical protein FO519_007852 [Halicephalobus sp. NKZ332]|nr:hypothetical protein FO519_007852 [Halicephalobus sp. NKZ332]
MPVVVFSTDRQLPKEFDQKFVEFLGKTLNKPPENIFVKINDNQRLTLGGTQSPQGTAILEIKAVGIFNPVSNAEFSQKISEHLSEEIQIPPQRILIEFIDLNPSFVGKAGTTIEKLLSRQ